MEPAEPNLRAPPTAADPRNSTTHELFLGSSVTISSKFHYIADIYVYNTYLHRVWTEGPVVHVPLYWQGRSRLVYCPRGWLIAACKQHPTPHGHKKQTLARKAACCHSLTLLFGGKQTVSDSGASKTAPSPRPNSMLKDGADPRPAIPGLSWA